MIDPTPQVLSTRRVHEFTRPDHDDATEASSLLRLMSADALLRSCYQVGKAPLLPLFAASIGAAPALVGVIASVSTVTGIAVKPVVGAMADSWSPRRWILLAVLFFVFPSLMYRFVETPTQLVALRSVHGLATAVFGPATLIYIAKTSRMNLASRFGTFGAARAASYVVGPVAGGLTLTVLAPGDTYALLGLVSAMAFIPLLGLPSSSDSRLAEPRTSSSAMRSGLRRAWSSFAVWSSGLLEGGIHVALYGLKTFLPLHVVAMGYGVGWAGTVLSVQALCDMLARPAAGQFGDRIGHVRAVLLGLVGLAATLLLLPLANDIAGLIACCATLGLSQAIVFPSAMAFAVTRTSGGAPVEGAAIGAVGSLRNAGKVVGPVLAGLLVQFFGFAMAFQLIALATLVAAATIALNGRCRNPSTIQRS